MERKQALMSIPFPTTKKLMQSFLGAALFFKSFIPHYSTITAPLNSMLSKDFNWSDKQSWKEDYEEIFHAVKLHLQKSVALHYPDYSLNWILRTDASLYGVGAVLLQVKPSAVADSPDNVTYQPIDFVSNKFSAQAQRWTTIEQEAFAIYYAVHKLSYFLRCKSFILETDHNNLLWIEASQVPKVIRWRIFLQSFNFQLRHIPGKHNLVADWLSRAPIPTSDLDTTLTTSPTLITYISTVESPSPIDVNATISKVLTSVHGGRMGHLGARRTWLALNHFYPGHSIPFRVVADFVASCPICQKDRLGMTTSLPPLIRHLKPDHPRSTLGIDTLTITPVDQLGNQYIFVFVNHFTKFVDLYPSPTKDAQAVASALFQHFCRFGVCDRLLSDPGSEFLNEVIALLTKWFSIRHSFSLVDRHQSNGVERSNQSILRHLRALVYDERILKQWSSPTVLPLIQYILNSSYNSEINAIPFELHFGSLDLSYLRLPTSPPTTSTNTTHNAGRELGQSLSVTDYINLLNNNLTHLRQLSKKFQDELVHQRTQDNDKEHHSYQQGDFVLHALDISKPRPSKLTPRFSGPYEVISQYKNDVTCKHMAEGHILTFHLERLKLFTGTREEAFALACLDRDQYIIHEIIAYRGNPLSRTTLEFEVVFADGELKWIPYSKDLYDSLPYEHYCRSHPELQFLIYPYAEQLRRERETKGAKITA
eukprot:12403102-Karenia_brevis.AAC.1